MDNHKRSIAKSVIWRILGVIVLATVTWIFTHSWITVGLVTIIHHATFLLVFYLHERFWLKIKTSNQKLRRVMKALVYEIILGMGIGGFIVLMVTGQWSKVTIITPTYTAIKLIMYYFYDKLWHSNK